MAKIIDDITFRGDNDTIVWKWFREGEDPEVSEATNGLKDAFFSGSVLSVHESQEALFYVDGECIGVLGAGRHILETDTIPFLKRIVGFVTGKKHIFHSKIFFVNKIELPMKWGVGDIVYEDPTGPVFTVGANGEINLTVTNPRALVERLSGVADSMSREALIERFRGLIASEVGDILVNTMIDNQIPITNIFPKMKKLSELLLENMENIFLPYGLNVTQFRILKIRVPEEDDQYKRLKRLKADKSLLSDELRLEQQTALVQQQTKSEIIKMEAEALAFKRKAEGYTYQQERQLDVLKAAVENENNGISGNLVDIGVGLGTAGVVGKMVFDGLQPIVSKTVTSTETPNKQVDNEIYYCPTCNAILPSKTAKFCPNCGTNISAEKFCENCGHLLTPSAKFCPECGTAVLVEKFCENCGHLIEPSAKFCLNCGQAQK